MTIEAAQIPVAWPLRGRPHDGDIPPSRPRHLRVVREGEGVQRASAPGRLRLTRRGRLVRTLAAFGVVSLFALLAWSRVTAPVLPPTHAVTVEQGQTLSQIAADELPMVPLEAAVLRITIANGLSSRSVMAGQALIIPGRD